MISQKLEKVRESLKASPREVAWSMLRGRFERFKCSFGTETTWTIPSLKLDVPNIGSNTSCPEAGIHNGQIAISRFVCFLVSLMGVLSFFN